MFEGTLNFHRPAKMIAVSTVVQSSGVFVRRRLRSRQSVFRPAASRCQSSRHLLGNMADATPHEHDAHEEVEDAGHRTERVEPPGEASDGQAAEAEAQAHEVGHSSTEARTEEGGMIAGNPEAVEHLMTSKQVQGDGLETSELEVSPTVPHHMILRGCICLSTSDCLNSRRLRADNRTCRCPTPNIPLHSSRHP